ncbi:MULTISPECIES: hypothetical protein [Streptomyces]|uniref:Transposase n=1 Tax=Streptomyces siderophoricus TaxID=2802281 RepID=A0ABS1MWC3_9ACTN|nr:hypothetical protein [Streptomyces sp. 9-7]MBL1092019.1 hypothetical protein [Streptomyces sp. 9-7]
MPNRDPRPVMRGQGTKRALTKSLRTLMSQRSLKGLKGLMGLKSMKWLKGPECLKGRTYLKGLRVVTDVVTA